MNAVVDVINLLGSLSSVIALTMTVVIFVKLKGISRSFLFQARFPILKKKLASHRSALLKLLNAFPGSRNDIAVELQRLVATLKSLIPKLDRGRRASVKNVLKAAQTLSSSSRQQVPEQLWSLYLAIVFVEEELANFSEDYRWRASQ